MTRQSVYYVGSESQVAHHAEPLTESLDVRIVGAEEVLSRAQPGELAIFFSEHFHQFRDAIDQLRERNVATLYAIDGILEWRNAWENRPDEPASPFTMRPVLSHKVACIGRSQARVLSSWGNESKVEVVGLPRLDRLRNRKPRQRDGDLRLLILSAKCPGFTDEQIERARTALRDVKRWCDANETIRGRRLVPYWRLTQDLASEIGVENLTQDLTGSDLANVLEDVDAVVTTPSTAMLEGMLQGLPVALLEYNLCPRYVPAVWEINTSEQIDAVMGELAEPSEIKLAHQQAILRDALECESAATPRIVELAEAMLECASMCVSNDEPLRFAPSILQESNRPEYIGQTSFQHAQFFPDEDVFHESDLSKLQIALADARRELDQRQARIIQLEKELGQAHGIFDEIHQHPIAGPVVRMRQKWIDFWSQRRGRKSSSESPNAKRSQVGGQP